MEKEIGRDEDEIIIEDEYDEDEEVQIEDDYDYVEMEEDDLSFTDEDEDDSNLDSEINKVLNEFDNREELVNLMALPSSEVNLDELATESKLDVYNNAKLILANKCENAMVRKNNENTVKLVNKLNQSIAVCIEDRQRASILNDIQNKLSFLDIKDISILNKTLANKNKGNGLVSDEELRETFNELPIDESIKNNNAYFLVFLNSMRERLEKKEKERVMIDEENAKIESVVSALQLSLLEDELLYTKAAIDHEKEGNCLVDKIYLYSDKKVLKCGNCGEETEFYHNPIVFIKTDNDVMSPIVFPVVCEHCNHLNVFSENSIRSLTTAVKNESKNFNSESIDSNPNRVAVYVPPAQLFLDKFSDVFVNRIDKEDREEVKESIDLNDMQNNFLRLVTSIHDKHKTSFNKIGYKNMAKLIIRNDDYGDVKKKALASLIQKLKSSGLEILSKSSVLQLDIMKQYEGKAEHYAKGISKYLNKIDLDEKGNVKDMKAFSKEYGKYLVYVEGELLQREQYIRDLDTFKFILADTPISNLVLNDEDIQNYLSDDELFKILDEISDLMIISNYGETFITNWTPRIYTKGSIQANRKYSIAFRNVGKPDSIGPDMPIKIDKYLDYFRSIVAECYGTNDSLDPAVKDENYKRFCANDFLISHCPYSYIVNDFSAMCRSFLNRDYYRALELSKSIMNNYNDYLVDIEQFLDEKYKAIFRLITKIPNRDLLTDKFDFYFGGGCNYTATQKESIINIYLSKKFLPRKKPSEMEYNDFVGYYVDLTINDRDEIVLDEEMMDFVEKYLVVLVAGSQMSTPANNFILYNLGKDLLLCLSDFKDDIVYKCLSMNKDVAIQLIKEDVDLKIEEFNTDYLIKYMFFEDRSVQDLMDENHSDFEPGYIAAQLEENQKSLFDEFEWNPKLQGYLKTLFKHYNLLDKENE